MCGILVFLLFMLAFRAKYISDGNEGFFDLQNSKAMRGFWCLIVLLVHIPQAYQNTIQDMLGSFAYIGVTFFFMTSAYGLSVGACKEPGLTKRFWTVRLPKLLIPNWVTNIFCALFFFITCGQGSSIGGVIYLHSWVKWLLGCYIVFWIGFYLIKKEIYRTQIVCILVCVLSISFYYMKHSGMIQSTIWCTEVFGFIWGIILYAMYDRIKNFFCLTWGVKVTAAFLLSLVLGICYLLFKGVFFWGDYVLKIILGLSILCFILILNGKIQMGNKISEFLGDISFEIYLLHQSVFKAIENMFPSISSGEFILISIILTVLLATIIHKVCNTLLNKLYAYNKQVFS